MKKITLNIEVDDPADLKATLLALLGTVNINKIEVQAQDPDKFAEKVAESVAAQPATKTKAKKAEEPKAATPAAEKPAEPAAAKKDEPKQETPKNGVSKKTAEPAAQTATPAASAGTGTAIEVELPDEVKNTSSMRDLLNYLAEHGVKDADTMVATCTAMKASVPILSKVPDVDARVRRAVEVLGLFNQPEV